MIVLLQSVVVRLQLLGDMEKWIDSFHCRSRAHCVACRAQQPMNGMVFPVECPYGVTLETAASLKPVAKPAEPQKWPTLALPMKLLAKPGDKGLGDIVARVIGPIGGDAFKAWYAATFGKSCGCEVRQEVWNRRYPL